MDEKYTETALHVEATRLPRLLERFLPPGPLALADLGCGDGPLFPAIADGSLEFVCSTMVMEHVPDERAYLDEIRRVLGPGGRSYLTTVFKKPWAWYFRKRDGESVLDTSHLREYTDLGAFRALLTEGGRFQVLALERKPLWFPLLDPLLFRLGGRYAGLATTSSLLRILRAPRVPIPGYYSFEVALERREEP